MRASEGAIAMRRLLWITATAPLVLVLAFPANALCQQQDQPKDAPKPQDSLADAARRAREQKKDTPKTGKVFTNDNLPTQGAVSTVGVAAAPPKEEEAGEAPATAAKEGAAPNDEKTWRERFAKLRDKLAKDEEELNLLQREMGVTNVQQYSDPVKALQQNLTRADINAKTAKVEQKKKDIEADKQALSDAEDDLRKSGGDVGWAR
jgi:chromosome segregation ATPase